MVDGLDANLAQIRDGFAWHYKQYEADQPAEDRPVYAKAEEAARAAKAGLWADPNPQPPWDFRHGREGGRGVSGVPIPDDSGARAAAMSEASRTAA